VPLAVAWQSDKLESANFLKLCNRIFSVIVPPCRKVASYLCRILQICCRLAFSAGLHCLRSVIRCVSGLFFIFISFAESNFVLIVFMFCKYFFKNLNCMCVTLNLQSNYTRPKPNHPDHGILVVENPILDANSVDFYGTTTLWCPSLNPVVGGYGTQP